MHKSSFQVIPCILCRPSYQICEYLYEKKHMYDKIIDCYLKDLLRQVTSISSDQSSGI